MENFREKIRERMKGRCRRRFARDVCFSNHSKEEVFTSIRDAFLSLKDDFLHNIRDMGIEAKDVVIAGGVARGDFGCRGLTSVYSQLDQLIRIWPNEVAKKGRTLFGLGSTSEVFEKSREIFGETKWERIAKDDILRAVCSDIDLFLVVEDLWEAQERRGERGLERVIENFERAIDERVPGVMLPKLLFTDERGLEPPVLSTREDFEKVRL